MNIFLLLVSLLPYFVSSATAAAAAASAPLLSSNKNANAKAGGVYELTSVTLDANIRDGSLWLVEFYAPWCRHCSTFAPTYDQLAHSIHSGNSGRERPIKLAKVNGDKERASTSRFNIQGYPMFFVVDGWKVYQYDGARSEDALKTFVVRDGYKAQNPLPIWSSPMGPLGQIQAMVFWVGNLFFAFYYYLTENQGFSPAYAAFLFAFGGMFTGLVTMVVVAIMLSGKMKED